MLALMNGQQPALAQLYERDHERAALLAEAEAVREQLREVEVVAALDQQRRALARRLKDERARVSDLSWELDETEQRLASLLAEGMVPDDILVAREAADLRRRKAKLEDDALQQMEQLERTEQEQIETEAAWLRHSGIWAERAGVIRAAAVQVEAQLVVVRQSRDALLAALPKEQRAQYDAASARHPLTPLAHVEQGACEGCRTPLDALLLAALPALCPGCARIVLPFVSSNLR